MSAGVFILVAGRDLQLAGRRRFEALLPVVFFIVAASLFPLGVGPEPQILRQIAPGVVWVCALLAAMLSLNTLFASDHQDGSLEQMLLSRHSTVLIAAGKALAHWVLTGLPLILAAPVLGVLFDMRSEAILTMVAGLMLGTPVLSLLGSIGAALTLGLAQWRGADPVCWCCRCRIPVLIFGAGAVGDGGFRPVAGRAPVPAGRLAVAVARGGAPGGRGGAAHFGILMPNLYF